jgi:hypothetical protein
VIKQGRGDPAFFILINGLQVVAEKLSAAQRIVSVRYKE